MHKSCWLAIGLLAGVGAALGASSSGAPLVEAAKNVDRQTFQTLLKDKTTAVNAPAADGSTALHWAVHRDNLEMVDALIRNGADVNVANRYGVRPLSLAAENGNATILGKLLDAGADPNTSMPEGETALMTAARAGNADAVKLLLVHHANVNARDSRKGETALMWAAARNNADTIRMLIEFGADVQARTNRVAPTPLKEQTKTAEQSKLADFEAGRLMFSSPPPTGFSALMFAVRAGQTDAVKALLDAKANVNDVLSDGESALIVAVANAHWELADYLLDRGADPNLAGAGWNALHQAVRERRPNIGFGTPGPIPTGKLDSIEVIRKMLAKGATLNARMNVNGMKDGQRNRLNRLGATAFLLAAKNTDIEVMKLLLAAGADPKIPVADMTTPLMVSSGLYLWNPGEDGGSLLGQEEEVLEAVKICVDSGNDVNAKNIYGETALHGAAYRGANLVVQYLVDKGASLEAKDVHGWTPLTVANGINYSDFFKQQLVTADLLKKLMQDRGLSVENQVADGKECLDCLQTRTDEQHDIIERDKRMQAEYAAAQQPVTRK